MQLFSIVYRPATKDISSKVGSSGKALLLHLCMFDSRFYDTVAGTWIEWVGCIDYSFQNRKDLQAATKVPAMTTDVNLCDDGGG